MRIDDAGKTAELRVAQDAATFGLAEMIVNNEAAGILHLMRGLWLDGFATGLMEAREIQRDIQAQVEEHLSR
jgi:hypothetical protein